MLEKVGEKSGRLARYLVAGGLGTYLCLFDELFGRVRVRPVTINGHQIYIRTNTSDLYVVYSCFYHREYDYLSLSDPEIIIDAGANIGASSIFFARKYPNARIFAIEPETSNFELLKQNIQNYHNIIPIKAAIWGETGTRTIQNRFTGHWGFTVSETTNKTELIGQEINCITIHSLMKEYGFTSIDLLKMDIEGGEKDVLENSQDWMDSVKIITVELHDKIHLGCEQAFYDATKDFKNFEKHGEKVTAYRD